MVTLDLAHLGDRCGNGFAPCQHPTLCSCGEALKAQGIARATEAASPDDRSRIDAAIRTVAARGVVFSANDVRPLIVWRARATWSGPGSTPPRRPG
jgi:hypothetical protein